MSEYRRDRTSGVWVIVAPERSCRPDDSRSPPQAVDARPAHDPSCPFCPGNERLLPGIIAETPAPGQPGWSVRVVPNKYPALRPDAAPRAADDPAGNLLPGFGHHEVVVETPCHDLDVSDFAAPDLLAVLETYRARYLALAARPGIRSVVIFRNRGHRAGASLHHPHSQIIATGIVPPRPAAAAEWARQWHRRTGQCPTCEDLRAELGDGRRLIETTDRFVAVVPFAAAGPCEVWIVPRQHQPSFADADGDDLADLGGVLQRTIRRLDAVLGRRSYSYAVESNIGTVGDAVSFHWHLRIVPRVATAGGFELASGLPINPSSPEDDAAALRAAGEDTVSTA